VVFIVFGPRKPGFVLPFMSSGLLFLPVTTRRKCHRPSSPSAFFFLTSFPPSSQMRYHKPPFRIAGVLANLSSPLPLNVKNSPGLRTANLLLTTLSLPFSVTCSSETRSLRCKNHPFFLDVKGMPRSPDSFFLPIGPATLSCDRPSSAPTPLPKRCPPRALPQYKSALPVHFDRLFSPFLEF